MQIIRNLRGRSLIYYWIGSYENITSGAGSALNITGALVEFLETSGNTFVVTNTATPTTTISGIPVSEGTTGDILIGSNPIINQGSPSQVTVTAGSSVILTSGGGKVNITAGGL